MLDENNFFSLINENLGKILGGFLGLLVAIIIMIFGFWRGSAFYFSLYWGRCLSWCPGRKKPRFTEIFGGALV